MDGETKSEFFALRLTPAEKRKLEENARRNSVSMAEYVRAVCCGTKVIKLVPLVMVAEEEGHNEQ